MTVVSPWFDPSRNSPPKHALLDESLPARPSGVPAPRPPMPSGSVDRKVPHMPHFASYTRPEPFIAHLASLDGYEGRVDYLGDLLRGLRLHFTYILSSWLDCGLRRVARVPDTLHLLTEHEARLLGLPPGTEVVSRRGWMVAENDRYDRVHLASIDSLIHPGRLGLDGPALAEFTAGGTPLGALVAGSRVTHYAFPVVLGEPEFDDLSMPPALPDDPNDLPVLRSLATLERHGKPFAIAAERIYKPVIEHTNVARVRNLLAPLLDGVA